jgi:flagellar M-ring protein FliF
MSFLENLRSYSPVRQILLAAGAAVVIGALLVATYFVVFNHPYAVLYANLRTADAAAITAELDKKKIAYRLEDGGATILAPADQVDGIRLVIANEDLPIKDAVGFELFNKSDMGLTEFAQRINYQRALQGELARTIMTMASVDTARVHLTLADPTVFRDDRRPSKASVEVVARPGARLAAETVSGIQRLIAASVPDLAADDVVVLDGDGKPVSGDPPAPAPASPQAQVQQAIEQYYAAHLQQALAAVFPGRTEVSVEARAEPSPSSIDGADAALAAWTPADRRLPLTVAISFPSPPTAEVQAQVRALAAQAIGLDPTKGDSLTLATSAATADQPAAVAAPAVRPALTATAPAAPRQGGGGLNALWVVLGGLVVLLLGAAGYLAFRRAGQWPRRLSERQRSEFASKFRTLLDEREEHATP